MVTIDFQKMRKELISLYEKFVNDLDNPKIKEEFMIYGSEFGGLTAYNDYLKSPPVPKDIQFALCGIDMVLEYGWFESRDKIYTKEKIFNEVKKILKDLKKGRYQQIDNIHISLENND